MSNSYLITIATGRAAHSRCIEVDEMDAVLILGKIGLLTVEDAAVDILIEISKT